MIINEVEATIHSKIVYVGPAMSGKTTTLKVLSEYYRDKLIDDFLSIENSLGRTLYFDYLLLFFKNKRYSLKAHIYSTTGQDFYAITRPDTIRNVDGIVFIADSVEEALLRNITSWKEIENYLGSDFLFLPKVIVFNKQDLSPKFDKNMFLSAIRAFKYSNLEITGAVATEGEGVIQSFRTILKLILENSPYLNSSYLKTEKKEVLT
jgi:GTPase SAR1 family protein